MRRAFIVTASAALVAVAVTMTKKFIDRKYDSGDWT